MICEAKCQNENELVDSFKCTCLSRFPCQWALVNFIKLWATLKAFGVESVGPASIAPKCLFGQPDRPNSWAVRFSICGPNKFSSANSKPWEPSLWADFVDPNFYMFTDLVFL